MVFILPKEQTTSESVGSAIGNALQMLAHNKINEVAQQKQYAQQSKGLQALGYSPEQASGLSGLDSSLLAPFLKEKAKTNFPMANNENANIGQFFEGLTPNQLQAYQTLSPGEKGTILRGIIEDPSRFIKNYQNPQPSKQSDAAERQILNQVSKPESQSNEKQLKPTQAEKDITKLLQEPKVTPAQRVAQLRNELIQQGVPPKQATTEANRIRKEEEKQQTEKPKLAEKKQQHIDKKYAPYLEKVNKEADAAATNIDRLKRMHELIETGNLTSPTTASFIDTLSKIPFFGIDLTGLLSPESQEFKKLSRDFLVTAKDIFGSRITEGEVKIFLDRVPNLSLSDGGKLAVINNLMRISEGALLKQKASQDIIEKNNNETPNQLDKLVNHKIKPQLDQLAKDFARAGHRRVLKTHKFPQPLLGQELVQSLQEQPSNLLSSQPLVSQLTGLKGII